jgi:hypothetical protein
VLIAERRNDDGTREERRYVPEGMPENERQAMCRKLAARNNALMREREELANDSYEARKERDCKQAEIDGLKWVIEERGALVRDLLAVYFEGIECNLGDCRDCSHRDWPNPCEGWLLFDRAEQAGIEV